ncbi:MAG: hypothetical protein V4619_01615 [Bacteroidota bacterium]
MSVKWLKHILVFVCLFSILEGTGISLLSALTKYKLNQTEQQLANDDESTSERNEVRETRLKEYLPSDFLIAAPMVTIIETITYPQQQPHAHLAWVPPVPTPPPNRLV